MTASVTDEAVRPTLTPLHDREWRQRLTPLGPKNIGAVYVFAIVMLVFGVASPGVFLTGGTFTAILDQQAIPAVLTIGLVVALSAGLFDLSFGYTLGVTNVLFAWLLVNTNLPFGVDLLVTLAVGTVVGMINGLIVVGWKLDSFIVTLATGSLLEGLQIFLSGNQNIVPTNIATLDRVTGRAFSSITYPVIYLAVLSLIIWYVLEFTPLGRRLFATGSGLEAARLMGVRTGIIRIGAFIVVGTFAAFGGFLETGLVGQGSPTVGPEFLLPAYAAAFLGATQLRQSRFNVWGTLIALYLLATASQGLFIVGAPSWVTFVFNGAALLAAIILSRAKSSSSVLSRVARLRDQVFGRRHGDEPVAAAADR